MSLNWHKLVPPPKGAVLPWPPPSPELTTLSLALPLSCKPDQLNDLAGREPFTGFVWQDYFSDKSARWWDSPYTQGKQQGADKTVGLVFSAQVRSYISFRQPLDSPFGVRSFSHTKLNKRVPKECNKRLQKNAEVTKSGFKFSSVFPKEILAWYLHKRHMSI